MFYLPGVSEQDEFTECIYRPQSDYADITSCTECLLYLLQNTLQRHSHQKVSQFCYIAHTINIIWCNNQRAYNVLSLSLFVHISPGDSVMQRSLLFGTNMHNCTNKYISHTTASLACFFDFTAKK